MIKDIQFIYLIIYIYIVNNCIVQIYKVGCLCTLPTYVQHLDVIYAKYQQLDRLNGCKPSSNLLNVTIMREDKILKTLTL